MGFRAKRCKIKSNNMRLMTLNSISELSNEAPPLPPAEAKTEKEKQKKVRVVNNSFNMVKPDKELDAKFEYQ